MKTIIQLHPTVGPISPYRIDEGMRGVDTEKYVEIEIPVPTHNRTGLPEGYLVMYLVPMQENVSLVLSNFPDGIQKFIDFIRKHQTYELAFRRNWPLLDYLLVKDEHVLAEFVKRPVLITVQDPDDGLSKWMLGRQITIPGSSTNAITEIELVALNSLIEPSLRLQAEIHNASLQVKTAFVQGKFKFPKTTLEKLEEILGMLNDVKDIAEYVAGK